MLAVLLARATQFLLALAMMRVATTLLSPAEMGKVSLVLTTTAFFALFLVNPVGMFINRRLHVWQVSGAATQYLTRYAIYLLLVALVSVIGLMFIYEQRLVEFGVSIGWLIFLVSGSLIFNTINQTAIPSLNLLGESRRFVALTLLTIAASFSFATLLVKTLQPSAQNWLLGLLLGQAMLAVIGTMVLFRKLKKTEIYKKSARIQSRHLLTLLKFSWPVALSAGLGWVQGQGYRYNMEGQLGLAELGIFVAGYGISAGIIAGFESVLTTYFQPRLYRDVSFDQQPSKYSQAWHRYAAVVIPSLVLTVAFIVILAPELSSVFLGKSFQSSADFIIWGALAESARVLVGVYTLIAHVYMRTRWLILPNLVGASLAIILCALLIPSLGAVGVGISLATSGFAVVVMLHVLLVRHVGGGTPVHPILIAAISSAVLWVITISLRLFLHSNVTGWLLIGSTLVPVTLTYLVLQYVFLRPHINDKVEK